MMNLKRIFFAIYTAMLLLLTLSFISLNIENKEDLAATKLAIHSQATRIWREDGLYTFTTFSGNTYTISDDYEKELIDDFIHRKECRNYLIICILLAYPLMSLAFYSLYERACDYQQIIRQRNAEIAQQKAYLKSMLAQQQAQEEAQLAEQKAMAEARKNLVPFDWAKHEISETETSETETSETE